MVACLDEEYLVVCDLEASLRRTTKQQQKNRLANTLKFHELGFEGT